MLSQFLAFWVTFSAASLGYYFFRCIHFPAAPLLGSMAATGVLGFTELVPSFDTGLLTFICATVLGINLGKQIRRDILARVLASAKPVAIHAGGMLLTSLFCGYFLYVLMKQEENELSLASALLCTSAGGVTEMTLLGVSLGANVMIIFLFQLVRQVTFLSLIPYSAKAARLFGDGRDKAVQLLSDLRRLPSYKRIDYVFLVVVATVGGYLGYSLGIPAGTLFGSMTCSGIFTLFLKKQYVLDVKIRLAAQIGLGIIMGQGIEINLSELVTTFLIPMCLVTLAMILCCLLLAFLLYKTTDYDLNTCLICSAPTGLSQIAVLAEEEEADVLTATLFHVARVISIVGIYPWVIMCFS